MKQKKKEIPQPDGRLFGKLRERIIGASRSVECEVCGDFNWRGVKGVTPLLKGESGGQNIQLHGSRGRWRGGKTPTVGEKWGRGEEEYWGKLGNGEGQR